MAKQEQCKVEGSKSYVLKFDMHCQCNGCVKKIKYGVKGISLLEGVERADVSVESGEVKVTGRMDPEKLCCLLQEGTKKCVRIVEQGVPSPSQGRIARPQHGQVPSDRVAPYPEAGGGWRRGDAAPSAPPLPKEAWRETVVASGRCWYRWAAPGSGSTIGVWAASDVTGTLAMYDYEL